MNNEPQPAPSLPGEDKPKEVSHEPQPINLPHVPQTVQQGEEGLPLAPVQRNAAEVAAEKIEPRPVQDEGEGTLCEHCNLPIRETHQGRVRNEWEHMDGKSFCADGKNWAWPVSPLTRQPESQPLEVCDTTMTPRAPRTACGCDTYPENLGCCATFELGANGNCAYCDHSPTCHRAHWGLASAPITPSEVKREPWVDAPDSQGWWWHWDENPDHAPHIYSVLTSLSRKINREFIASPDSRWCIDVGGKWQRMTPPVTKDTP